MKPLAYLPIILLALGCAVCGVYAWNEYNELVTLRASTLGNDTEAALRKDIWRAQKEITDLQKRLAGTAGTVAQAGGPSDNPEAGPAERKIDPQKEYMELMKNPEFRKLQLMQMQNYLDQNFAGLYKQLNLTPDQLAQFRALAVERVASAQDAYAMAIEQGIDPKTDPKGFQAVMKGAIDAVDTKIKAVIGDDGFKTAATYYQTQAQRSVATELQQSLSYTSAPLTDAQANQLTDILSKNAQPRDPTSVITVIGPMGNPVTMKGVAAAMPGPAGNIQPVAGISDAAVNQATGVLSQQQVAALKQLQQVQQSEHDLGALSQSAPKSGGK